MYKVTDNKSFVWVRVTHYGIGIYWVDLVSMMQVIWIQDVDPYNEVRVENLDLWKHLRCFHVVFMNKKNRQESGKTVLCHLDMGYDQLSERIFEHVLSERARDQCPSWKHIQLTSADESGFRSQEAVPMEKPILRSDFVSLEMCLKAQLNTGVPGDTATIFFEVN